MRRTGGGGANYDQRGEERVYEQQEVQGGGGSGHGLAYGAMGAAAGLAGGAALMYEGEKIRE